LVISLTIQQMQLSAQTETRLRSLRKDFGWVEGEKMSKMKRIIRNKKKKKFLRENPAWEKVLLVLKDKDVVKVVINYNQGAIQLLDKKKQIINLISIHFNESEGCRLGDDTKWLMFKSPKDALRAVLFIEAETGKTFYETHEMYGIIYLLDIGYARKICISEEKINSWDRKLLNRAKRESLRGCVNL